MAQLEIPGWVATVASAVVTGAIVVATLKANMSALEKRFDERWKTLEEWFRERWSLLDKRIDVVEKKIERVTPRVADLTMMRRDLEVIREEMDFMVGEKRMVRRRTPPAGYPAIPESRDSDEEEGQ